MCGRGAQRAGAPTGIALSPNDHVLLAVVAMSACLGAVVRAPLTSILIVFEMTHDFALVPALLAGALISQTVSRALLHHSFYEQVLLDDGHTMRTFMPPRDLRAWRQYPVSAIANFQPVVLLRRPRHACRPAQPLAEHPAFERFRWQQIRRPAGLGPDCFCALPPWHHYRWGNGQRCVGPTCLREAPISEAQARLIESPVGAVLILDKSEDGIIVGLLTLHDLLRAQDALARDGDAP